MVGRPPLGWNDISTDAGFGSPHVHMEWKPSKDDMPESEIMMDRYCMQLKFGQINNGKVSGKIYICLPDKNKSVAAGTFMATIK